MELKREIRSLEDLRAAQEELKKDMKMTASYIEDSFEIMKKDLPSKIGDEILGSAFSKIKNNLFSVRSATTLFNTGSDIYRRMTAGSDDKPSWLKLLVDGIKIANTFFRR